jgi:hypothetical protein
MTTSTARHTERAQAPGIPSTIALGSAAWNSLGRLQENTGLSKTELATCALTWYAYFDTQLRAGYNLTLWNAREGKAYTLSLPAGTPEVAKDCRLPGNGEAGSAPATVRLYGRASWPSGPRPRGRRHRRPPAPVFTPTKPWLAGASSRGSPVSCPCPGGALPAWRPVIR